MLLAEALPNLLGERLICSFIHQIAPLGETATAVASAPDAEALWLRRLDTLRIHFGRTYVAMAHKVPSWRGQAGI